MSLRCQVWRQTKQSLIQAQMSNEAKKDCDIARVQLSIQQYKKINYTRLENETIKAN